MPKVDAQSTAGGTSEPVAAPENSGLHPAGEGLFSVDPVISAGSEKSDTGAGSPQQKVRDQIPAADAIERDESIRQLQQRGFTTAAPAGITTTITTSPAAATATTSTKRPKSSDSPEPQPKKRKLKSRKYETRLQYRKTQRPNFDSSYKDFNLGAGACFCPYFPYRLLDGRATGERY